MYKKIIKGIRIINNSMRIGFRLLPYQYLRVKPRYQESMVKLLGQKFKIADGLSFYHSYKEIFGEGTYKFNSKNDSPIIVDCGSNIGTSIVYFKTLYPESKIFGIEADPGIYNILEWNIKQRKYKNVSLINKALSNSSDPIYFLQEGADGGRILENTEKKQSVQVNTIHLDELISKPIDFLKMDIEGAETEVITSSKNLGNVPCLFIEYHSFKNSPQNLNQLLTKLSSENFRYYIHTQFCSPRPLTEDKLQLDMDLQLNIFAKKQ